MRRWINCYFDGFIGVFKQKNSMLFWTACSRRKTSNVWELQNYLMSCAHALNILSIFMLPIFYLNALILRTPQEDPSFVMLLHRFIFLLCLSIDLTWIPDFCCLICDLPLLNITFICVLFTFIFRLFFSCSHSSKSSFIFTGKYNICLVFFNSNKKIIIKYSKNDDENRRRKTKRKILV